MWSLGCLLYELVTGRYLYADDDWIRMFVRVTKARMHIPCPRSWQFELSRDTLTCATIPVARFGAAGFKVSDFNSSTGAPHMEKRLRASL